MLNSIVSWALNMRVLVVAAAIALLFVGVNATKNAPLDVSPSSPRPSSKCKQRRPVSPPRKSMRSSPCRWRHSLNGLPFLKTIRSKSVLGLSSVVMIFKTGTDILQARQLVPRSV